MDLGVPTAEDVLHDYLWRVHMAIPQKGQIAIFNRSHYDDVIEVHVHNLVPKNELTLRYRQINDFERYLSENHLTTLKFFLHISKDEQKKRLQERIKDPTKRWKISESDFKTGNIGISICNPMKKPWVGVVLCGHHGMLSLQI